MTAETSATIACRTLHLALDDLDAEAVHAVSFADVEELVAVHVELTRAKRHLTLIATIVEDALADVMPDKIVEIPGLPPVELRSGTRRVNWQSLDLLDELFRVAVVDTDTGEVLRDETIIRQRLYRVLTDCVPFTGSLGWHKTALKSYGIDPDEWSESKPGRRTVQVHEDAVEAVTT